MRLHWGCGWLSILEIVAVNGGFNVGALRQRNGTCFAISFDLDSEKPMQLA
jgi:hypothetical protein